MCWTSVFGRGAPYSHFVCVDVRRCSRHLRTFKCACKRTGGLGPSGRAQVSPSQHSLPHYAIAPALLGTLPHRRCSRAARREARRSLHSTRQRDLRRQLGRHGRQILGYSVRQTTVRLPCPLRTRLSASLTATFSLSVRFVGQGTYASTSPLQWTHITARRL